MRRSKFYEKERKISKINLLVIGVGVLAILITGFLYVSKLQQQGPLMKTVAAVAAEKTVL